MNLEIDRRDEVCELRLNAPPGNIIDRATCEAMTAAVHEYGADKHLKAFLFTAAGKHFSFGASVPEHAPGEVERFLPAFHELFLTLADSHVPCVAAVRGMCLGGAFELAAFCHYVVAEPSARFAAPEIKLGVLPPAACVILPWRVGGAVAEDLILSGRSVTAQESRIVARLCDEGELESAVEALLDEHVRPLSAASLRLAVKAVRAPLHAEMHLRLPLLESIYLEELMASRDANEGIAAFLEKREPVWVDA